MKTLTDLLYKPRQDGYPVDFLLARLGSRLAGFSSRCPIGGGEATWQELQQEYSWLYSCMGLGFRRELSAVFLCFELRNIHSAIRFAKAGDKTGIESVLRSSLLSRDLKGIFLNTDNPLLIIRKLSADLSSLDKGFAGLERIYLDNGLPVLEKAVLDSFLSAAIREGLSDLTTCFLLRFTEKRNLMVLAKEKRWGLENILPAFTESREALRFLERKSRVINGMNPGAAEDPARMDNLLIGKMARDFRRYSRSGQALAKLLDYILSCYIAARNCGVKGIEPLLGNVRTGVETVL